MNNITIGKNLDDEERLSATFGVALLYSILRTIVSGWIQGTCSEFLKHYLPDVIVMRQLLKHLQHLFIQVEKTPDIVSYMLPMECVTNSTN
jgi:hypothetical protein